MIGQIEDKIIQTLQAGVNATPGLGYKLASQVASYGGELDELTAEQIRALPAIWVTYAGGGEPKKANSQGTKWIMPANFAVIVAARNVRGERATRQGMTVAGQIREVGVYQMLEDVSLMLMNNDIGLAIRQFRPGRIRTLYNTRLGGQAMAVFAREFNTAYVETEPRQNFDPTSGDFLKVGIDFYLRPDDGVVDDQTVINLN
jgi:phage gp37-like protein